MNARHERSPARMWGGLALLFSLAGLSLGWTEDEQPYSGEGFEACLKCHESEKIVGIKQTAHADFDDPRSPAAKEQCESCHGPSAIHMEFPMQVGNIVFTKHGKTPVSARNRQCLSCHDKGDRAHWNEGAHGRELACNNCHTIHKPKDPMLQTAGQVERCADSCHEKILETAPANASHRFSGKDAMYCTQCHNPHGPTSLTACAECHEQDEAAFAKQTPRARGYHERAIEKGIECTECHKGFVHALPVITQVERAPEP